MKKAILPLLIFFVIINALALVFSQRLNAKGVDVDVVMIGNLILFLTSVISVIIYSKSINQKKAHSIVKNVYGGFILKFFVLIVAVMVYFFFASEINKAAIFICMGLYLVYTFLGTVQAVKKNSSTSNTHHRKK